MTEKKRTNNIVKHSLSQVLSSKNKKSALQKLKSKLEYSELDRVINNSLRKIEKLSFSVYGNLNPKKISDLGKSEQFYKPLSIEGEINWLQISIKKEKDKIRFFLLQKKKFENYFLLSDFYNAEKILDIVLDKTGISLWYIEARFLLLEYQNEPEKQKLFLSEINEKNKEGTISTVVNFLSQRTEKNLSAYKYDYDISNLFKTKSDSSDGEKETKNLYKFRLNFFEDYDLDDYKYILLFENKNSIIDRYLTLIKVFKVMYLKGENRSFIYYKSLYLFRKMADENLYPLLFAYNLEFDSEKYFDSRYMRIVNLYYQGDYKEVIKQSTNFIQKNPSQFDLLLLYVKSHISLNISYFDITFSESTLINQIGLKIYSLLKNEGNKKTLLYSLYQINKNLNSFNIAGFLNSFLKEEQNIEVDSNLKLLYNNKFNPKFASFFQTENEADLYLNYGLVNFPDSISIKHWLKISKAELSDIEVCEEILLSDNAKILFFKEKYEEAIIEFKKVLNTFPNNLPIIKEAIKFWFKSLVRQKKFNEAISLFVDNYIKDNSSIDKIDSNALLVELRKIRYKAIKRSIDLPIFVELNSEDDPEKSFVLEQYYKIFNKKNPTELFESFLSNETLKVEFFFNRVCNYETLKHSININNTVHRLTERQNIINYLIDNYPKKSEVYKEELNLVSNELIIYEGTQKLDESKIYANDQAIINNELTDIEGLFNRYKTIYNLASKESKVLVITKDSFALFKLGNKDNFQETEVKYSDSALIEVFSELFDLILDKYLFSKYGIVAYLSTRIRHGVLLGEIRPEFEKKNLILSRVGNSEIYEESNIWNKPFFGLDNSQKKKLHEILSKFSYKIDSEIESIIKNKIQIKRGTTNNEGLFNYDFDKTELYQFAHQLSEESDAKIFCQKIIDLIWKRTDANLEVIRSYIDKNIKDSFSLELNNLEKDLRDNFNNNELPQIFTNLIECSTIIENKLSKISSWFRRSGTSIVDFSIQKVFDIVWINTERCFTKIAVECNISYGVNPIIKSNYYIHFTDLFRILVDNMFKYGSYNGSKKEFEFKTLYDDECMIFTFISDKKEEEKDFPFMISEKGHVEINRNKLISEKKSGISKAVKIVKYDLENEDNYIKIDTNGDKFIVTVSIKLEKLVTDE
ncbi:tetratricopeptide repeat protein [Thalassobellus suaedae]|uniref:Uncharacterized protein n=1 Tax=Thalassobellus suaedae TaxID=3074124 RepID=A0ABY9Y2G4_9FLAO|nr:hypothetical protein RHP49_15510 [Flavobacteriaceae bacterium HL-DH10]